MAEQLHDDPLAGYEPLFGQWPVPRAPAGLSQRIVASWREELGILERPRAWHRLHRDVLFALAIAAALALVWWGTIRSPPSPVDPGDPAGAISPEPVAITEDDTSPELVRKGIGTRIHELRECYRAALVESPEISGKHRYTIVIDDRGKVTGVTIDEDTLGVESVAVCARATVRGWTFDGVASAMPVVSFVVVFTADQ